MEEELISINASLVDPTDPTEINIVTAVAGVGTTDRLASGHRITWTPDILRAKAGTLVGKPINILLNEQGDATDHSRKVIGAVKEAHFDEEKQVLMATGAIWGHYFPKTVERMKELFAKKKFTSSMEYSFPPGTLKELEDGSQTPTVGGFSGLGLVGRGGDPRAMVYLMAALREDESAQQPVTVGNVIKELVARLLGTAEEEGSSEETEELEAAPLNEEEVAAHEGSFEWLNRQLNTHLMDKIKASASGDMPMAYPTVLATYSNYAIYTEGEKYFRIDWKRSGDKLNFGEPQEVDPVYQPTAKASAEEGGVDPADNTGILIQGEQGNMSDEKDTQIEELKASLDAANATLNEMKAAQEAREAEELANKRADERLAEIEKIVPVKDELKAALRESLKGMDDAAYEVAKANFAATAEIAAGIAPGEEIENPDPTPSQNPQEVADAEMAKFREEAQAQFGTGQSEDKE